MKAIILGMFEQGKAFKCSPFGVNNFMKPRNEKQEKCVMMAHRAAVKVIKEVNPDIKVGLTLSLFDFKQFPAAKSRLQSCGTRTLAFICPTSRMMFSWVYRTIPGSL